MDARNYSLIDADVRKQWTSAPPHSTPAATPTGR